MPSLKKCHYLLGGHLVICRQELALLCCLTLCVFIEGMPLSIGRSPCHMQTRTGILLCCLTLCVFIEGMPLSIGRSPSHMQTKFGWSPCHMQIRTDLLCCLTLCVFIEGMPLSIGRSPCHMQTRTGIVMLFDIVLIHRRNAIIYWAVTLSYADKT